MEDYKTGDCYDAGLWCRKHIEAFVRDGNVVNGHVTEKVVTEIINSFVDWFSKPNAKVPGIITNHDDQVMPVYFDEVGRNLLSKLNGESK